MRKFFSGIFFIRNCFFILAHSIQAEKLQSLTVANANNGSLQSNISHKTSCEKPREIRNRSDKDGLEHKHATSRRNIEENDEPTWVKEGRKLNDAILESEKQRSLQTAYPTLASVLGGNDPDYSKNPHETVANSDPSRYPQNNQYMAQNHPTIYQPYALSQIPPTRSVAQIPNTAQQGGLSNYSQLIGPRENSNYPQIHGANTSTTKSRTSIPALEPTNMEPDMHTNAHLNGISQKPYFQADKPFSYNQNPQSTQISQHNQLPVNQNKYNRALESNIETQKSELEELRKLRIQAEIEKSKIEEIMNQKNLMLQNIQKRDAELKQNISKKVSTDPMISPSGSSSMVSPGATATMIPQNSQNTIGNVIHPISQHIHGPPLYPNVTGSIISPNTTGPMTSPRSMFAPTLMQAPPPTVCLSSKQKSPIVVTEASSTNCVSPRISMNKAIQNPKQQDPSTNLVSKNPSPNSFIHSTPSTQMHPHFQSQQKIQNTFDRNYLISESAYSKRPIEHFNINQNQNPMLYPPTSIVPPPYMDPSLMDLHNPHLPPRIMNYHDFNHVNPHSLDFIHQNYPYYPQNCLHSNIQPPSINSGNILNPHLSQVPNQFHPSPTSSHSIRPPPPPHNQIQNISPHVRTEASNQSHSDKNFVSSGDIPKKRKVGPNPPTKSTRGQIHKQCTLCSTPAKFLCSGCHQIHYCSTVCQVNSNIYLRTYSIYFKDFRMAPYKHKVSFHRFRLHE